MGKDYVIFYAEASIVCIIILSILLIHARLHGTRNEVQVSFTRAVFFFILYFISDAFWAAVLGGALPRTRWAIVLLNLSNYIILALAAYEWFMFMAASEKMPFRLSKKKRLLCLLPAVISTLILAISYISNPKFWIDDAGRVNELYNPMQIAAPAFYLMAGFILSINNIRKAKTREEKQMCLLLGTFPLGVMAFGMLQVVTLDAPTFCFGCTIMWIWFYIQMMESMISMDDLTRLNNRGQINRYMDQVHYRENETVIIMMIDIDGFKQINDVYGHAEGDRALTLFAQALRQTCESIKVPAFIGRYGGDEFIIILRDDELSEECPAQVAEVLRGLLRDKQRENELPYALEISVGYDALRDKQDTMKDCLNRADEKLYREKRAKGAGR